MKKPKCQWQCDSLWSAYRGYLWPFGTTHPVTGAHLKGRTYGESTQLLFELADGLRLCLAEGDALGCRDHSISVLKWGGVRPRNDKRIDGLYRAGRLCSHLRAVQEQLDLNRFDSRNGALPFINSGFTKIYALLVDDFIMYDGRVGSALGLLVRLFCEERGLDYVPEELRFGYKRSREVVYSRHSKRNPSSEKHRFPEISANPRKHLVDNVRASWLLRLILDNTDSKFNRLDTEQQLIALQSALFMIGYDVEDTACPS